MSDARIRIIVECATAVLIRELLARTPEPLTRKQIAARLNRRPDTVLSHLERFRIEGTIKRRQSYQARRPFEYVLYDREWPSDTRARMEYQAARDAAYSNKVRVAIAATAEGVV